jgi:hypothetical protein
MFDCAVLTSFLRQMCRHVILKYSQSLFNHCSNRFLLHRNDNLRMLFCSFPFWGKAGMGALHYSRQTYSFNFPVQIEGKNIGHS